MKNTLVRHLVVCFTAIALSGAVPSTAVFAQAAGGQDTAGAAQAGVERLITTMQIDAVIEVLRIEGVDYGTSIEDEMFPDQGGAAWQATVARIYNPHSMKTAFAARLADELKANPQAVAEAEAFFASPLGRRLLELELEARRSLLDDETEAAAELAWNDLAAEGGPRVDLLRRFAEVNDLVDSNVMGALNSNLAFYQGMAGTGAFAGEFSEEQTLSDVWAQEADIRQQTENWVYPYLNLGYSSLTDDELKAYVEFSASDAGQALNSALFAAFDAVFVPISRALGAAAALHMKGQDI